MTMLVKESPVIYFEGKARDPDQRIEETEIATTFYEFKFFMPEIVPVAGEMTDGEVLLAATECGVLGFLDSPEEDVYSSEGSCG